MRILAFHLMLLACAAASAATIYKWVDENGVVHFSDQPHAGAEKVHVGAPQTFSAPKGTAPAAAPQEERTQRSGSCQVVSPGNEETLMNEHSVSGQVHLSPAPEGGEQVVIVLDGNPLPGIADSTGSFTISPIDRGEHTLSAQVLAPNGQVLCQGGSITFFVQQPSIQSPTNPVLHPPTPQPPPPKG